MKTANHKNNLIYAVIGCSLLLLGLVLCRKVVTKATSLLLFSGIIALLLSPVVKLYERRFTPGVAAALAILSALFCVALIVTAIIIPLINGAHMLYTILPRFIERFISDSNIFTGINLRLTGTDSLSFISKYLNDITTGAANLFSAIADIIIAFVIGWRMLVARHKIALQAELIIPSRYRESILRHISGMWGELGMYLRGQGIIAACVGALSAAGLWLAGIPYALPLGFTAGVLNMIPYLGPIIACLPVGLLALSEGIVPALISICVLIAVQQVDGLILSPRIVGDSTGFSPITVMVSIFAAGAVWGIPGMLSAMPGLILIRTCVRVFVELRHND